MKRLLFIFTLMLISSLYLNAQGLQAVKLISSINSKSHDEITPVLSSDGKTLFFTRVGSPDFVKKLVIRGNDVHEYLKPYQYKSYLRKIYQSITKSYVSDPFTSSCNQDIWVATSINDDFEDVVHPGDPLNNALPNSVCAISADQKSLIVINQILEDGGMQSGFSTTTQLENGSWGKLEHLNIKDFSTRKPAVNLTLSTDDEIIILSLDRVDSYGQNDLYVCHRIEGNNWGKPTNLGKSINSIFRETTPYLSPDNRTIYFSSNRKGSMGGNDIYMSKRIGDSWQNWTKPRRFRKPINSPANDSQPTFNEATGCLYFSSNRDGTSDIYKVKISEPKIYRKSYYSFNIIDAQTKKPIEGDIYITDNKYFYPVKEISKGHYSVKLPKGKTFTISFSKDGYLSQESIVDLNPNSLSYNSLNIKMIKREANIKIDLNPIYFKRSKSEILDKSHNTLNKLTNILIQNPGVSISIEGHTDNIGDKSLLMKLSRDRAASVKVYLVENGVQADRVKTVGYGPNYPLSNNKTEDSKSLNRRVEIFITTVAPL